MGRNAKRKAARFTPTVNDIDLLVEVFEIPGALLTFPALKARAESELGHQWLTPERQQHLVKHAAVDAYGDGADRFEMAVARVVGDAMADGLVVGISADDSDDIHITWSYSAAARLHKTG